MKKIMTLFKARIPGYGVLPKLTFSQPLTTAGTSPLAIALFFAVLLVCLCFTACSNPVMETWWGEQASRVAASADDGGRTYPLPGTFTVTFHKNGGTYVDLTPPVETDPPPQKVPAGEKAVEPGYYLEREDGGTRYFFDGWYTEPSGGVKWDFLNTPVTDDITLYANWVSGTGAGFEVTFNLNLSTTGLVVPGDIPYQPLPEYIAADAHATEPLEFGVTNPVKKYAFRGWFTENTCDNKWVFTEDTVSADTELFAGWASWGAVSPPPPGVEDVPPAKVYNIKFMSGISDDPPDQYVPEGSKIIAPFVRTNPGHAFSGWYTDPGFSGRPWDFTLAVSANNVNSGATGIILYARWVDEAPVIETVLQDITVISIGYILFSGGQTAYNLPASGANTTSLTPKEMGTNDKIIDSTVLTLNTNPEYRVMVIGHANPTTTADKANPMNPELMDISTKRAAAVKSEIAVKLGANTNTVITKGEGGRLVLKDQSLDRRAEIIIFDITTD